MTIRRLDVYDIGKGMKSHIKLGLYVHDECHIETIHIVCLPTV